MRSLLEVGHMRISQSADKPADDSPRKNRLQRRVKSPNGTYPQAGCVLFSVSACTRPAQAGMHAYRHAVDYGTK